MSRLNCRQGLDRGLKEAGRLLEDQYLGTNLHLECDVRGRASAISL